MPTITPIDPTANSTSVDPSIIIVFDILSSSINDLIDVTTVTITVDAVIIWENEVAITGWDVAAVAIDNSYRYYVTNFSGFSFNEDITVVVSVNGG
jgi:Na+/H+ antiporter NhaB